MSPLALSVVLFFAYLIVIVAAAGVSVGRVIEREIEAEAAAARAQWARTQPGHHVASVENHRASDAPYKVPITVRP